MNKNMWFAIAIVMIGLRVGGAQAVTLTYCEKSMDAANSNMKVLLPKRVAEKYFNGSVENLKDCCRELQSSKRSLTNMQRERQGALCRSVFNLR